MLYSSIDAIAYMFIRLLVVGQHLMILVCPACRVGDLLALNWFSEELTPLHVEDFNPTSFLHKFCKKRERERERKGNQGRASLDFGQVSFDRE